MKRFQKLKIEVLADNEEVSDETTSSEELTKSESSRGPLPTTSFVAEDERQTILSNLSGNASLKNSAVTLYGKESIETSSGNDGHKLPETRSSLDTSEPRHKNTVVLPKSHTAEIIDTDEYIIITLSASRRKELPKTKTSRRELLSGVSENKAPQIKRSSQVSSPHKTPSVAIEPKHTSEGDSKLAFSDIAEETSKLETFDISFKSSKVSDVCKPEDGSMSSMEASKETSKTSEIYKAKTPFVLHEASEATTKYPDDEFFDEFRDHIIPTKWNNPVRRRIDHQVYKDFHEPVYVEPYRKKSRRSAKIPKKFSTFLLRVLKNKKNSSETENGMHETEELHSRTPDSSVADVADLLSTITTNASATSDLLRSLTFLGTNPLEQSSAINATNPFNPLLTLSSTTERIDPKSSSSIAESLEELATRSSTSKTRHAHSTSTFAADLFDSLSTSTEGYLDPLSTSTEGYLDPSSTSADWYLDPLSTSTEGYLDPLLTSTEGYLDPLSTSTEGHLDPLATSTEWYLDPLSTSIVGINPVQTHSTSSTDSEYLDPLSMNPIKFREKLRKLSRSESIAETPLVHSKGTQSVHKRGAIPKIRAEPREDYKSGAISKSGSIPSAILSKSEVVTGTVPKTVLPRTEDVPRVPEGGAIPKTGTVSKDVPKSGAVSETGAMTKGEAVTKTGAIPKGGGLHKSGAIPKGESLSDSGSVPKSGSKNSFLANTIPDQETVLTRTVTVLSQDDLKSTTSSKTKPGTHLKKSQYRDIPVIAYVRRVKRYPPKTNLDYYLPKEDIWIRGYWKKFKYYKRIESERQQKLLEKIMSSLNRIDRSMRSAYNYSSSIEKLRQVTCDREESLAYRNNKMKWLMARLMHKTEIINDFLETVRCDIVLYTLETSASNNITSKRLYKLLKFLCGKEERRKKSEGKLTPVEEEVEIIPTGRWIKQGVVSR